MSRQPGSRESARGSIAAVSAIFPGFSPILTRFSVFTYKSGISHLAIGFFPGPEGHARGVAPEKWPRSEVFSTGSAGSGLAVWTAGRARGSRYAIGRSIPSLSCQPGRATALSRPLSLEIAGAVTPAGYFQAAGWVTR